MSRAFIDNGQIKIIDNEGVSFEEAIAERLAKARKFRALSFAGLFATGLLLIATLSPIFYDVITTAQNWLFGIACVIVGISTIHFFDVWDTHQTDYSRVVSIFNNAKLELQGDILQLRKDLAQHESQIDGIRNQEKFNFKNRDMYA